MQTIILEALTIEEATALRAAECEALERVDIATAFARGARKRQLEAWHKVHHANIMALSERIDGPAPDMTLDEIFAEFER